MSDFVPLADSDEPRFNGGVRCDMKIGPCACGAWHTEVDWIERGFEEARRQMVELARALPPHVIASFDQALASAREFPMGYCHVHKSCGCDHQ